MNVTLKYEGFMQMRYNTNAQLKSGGSKYLRTT